jgi:hypothetical protein
MFATIIKTQVVGFAMGFTGAAVATSSAEDLKRVRKGKNSHIYHKINSVLNHVIETLNRKNMNIV